MNRGVIGGETSTHFASMMGNQFLQDHYGRRSPPVALERLTGLKTRGTSIPFIGAIMKLVLTRRTRLGPAAGRSAGCEGGLGLVSFRCGRSQDQNEPGIEAIPGTQATIEALAFAAMKLGTAMRADVDKTRPRMQARVLFAVGGRSHAFCFTAESRIVTVMPQVDHLVLESVIHVSGKVGVIDPRQGDDPFAAVACSRNSHSG